MAELFWVTEVGVSRHRQDASREGRSICGRRVRYGATAAHDQYEMCGQCERLHRLKSTPSECAGQSADVVAEHGPDEDAMSAHLAGRPDTERVISVRGGPALDPQTEFEYTRERET